MKFSTRYIVQLGGEIDYTDKNITSNQYINEGSIL